MIEVDFRDVIWSREGMALPIGKKQVYRLPYVQLTPLDVRAEDDAKHYAVSLSRTRQVLCHLKVFPGDTDDFRTLQNLILSTKLGM